MDAPPHRSVTPPWTGPPRTRSATRDDSAPPPAALPPCRLPASIPVPRTPPLPAPKNTSRSRTPSAAGAPPAPWPAARLERRRLLEFRRLRFQPFIQRIRKHSPAVLRPALNAAIVAFAHAVEPPRIAHRQRPQHHRMNEREDRGRPANPQSQRQHRRRREHGSHAKLPQRITNIFTEGFHPHSAPVAPPPRSASLPDTRRQALPRACHDSPLGGFSFARASPKTARRTHTLPLHTRDERSTLGVP